MSAARRKKRKSGKKFLPIIALVLVAAIGLGIWLAFPRHGWEKTDEGTRYILPDTKMYAIGYQSIDGKNYIFNQSGYLLYGSIDYNGKKYQADSDGVLLSGWQEVSGEKLYFLQNGEGAQGFVTINGELYGFSQAKPVNGLAVFDRKLHNFDQDGKALIGTFTVEGVSATFDDTGLTSTGLFTVGADKYYFKNGEMQVDWQIINKKRYFFGGDGKMLTNTEIGYYEIGADGIAKQAKAKPSNLSYYIDSFISEYGSDEKGLFNAIKNNCSYKSADISNAAKPTYEETACDAINAGHGVCWHLASLAYCVYKQAGYEVYYVRGNGLTYEYHEWIYVKFKDGNYYHVDPSNWAGYKNTDEKMIERGYHTWEIYGFEN